MLSLRALALDGACKGDPRCQQGTWVGEPFCYYHGKRDRGLISSDPLPYYSDKELLEAERAERARQRPAQNRKGAKK